MTNVEIYQIDFFKRQCNRLLEEIRKELSTISVDDRIGQILWESYRCCSNFKTDRINRDGIIDFFIQLTNLLQCVQNQNIVTKASKIIWGPMLRTGGKDLD